MRERQNVQRSPESCPVAESTERKPVQLRGLDYAAQAALLSPVQRRGDGTAPDSVHEAAAHGLSGGASKLPHAESIQRSFGGHDVGNVQAHVGGKAAEGAAAMGAEAYASGSSVAFGSTPDLHTAAHEAAHVVQQRKGVQLSGGVGQVGDAYEQHADKVADAVVQGKSAEALLDPFAGPSGGGGVQRKVVQRIAVPEDIAAMSIDQCKAEARAMYIGDDDYAQRGIFDHKITAVGEMAIDLGRSDPASITSQIGLAALTVAVAAGAAALSVGTGGLAAALIAGGAAVITALPPFFAGGGNTLDATTFVSNYESAMREGWPASVAELQGTMTNEASARQVCAQTRALRANHERVKQTQRNEILDAWMTATAQAHDTSGNAGNMGGASYDDASEGRLHLSVAMLLPGGGFAQPTFATMEGVGLEKLRHYNLNRRVGDIKCPRTMLVNNFVEGAFSIAKGPTDAELVEEHGLNLQQAKRALASFYLGRELDENDAMIEGDHDQATIDDNWGNGLSKAWEQVTSKTLRQLGVTSIDS